MQIKKLLKKIFWKSNRVAMIDEKSEIEFSEWLESISFVDEDGNVLPVILEDDDSPDPENDRGES